MPVVNNDPSWNCRPWFGDALVDGKAVGTPALDWGHHQENGRVVNQGKEGGRAEGRYASGRSEELKWTRPAWDVLDGQQVIG